jgi:Ala-tRNA(Pro) deacylase
VPAANDCAFSRYGFAPGARGGARSLQSMHAVRPEVPRHRGAQEEEIMAIVGRLQKLLAERGLKHTVLPHRDAFTAWQVAQTVHVAGRLFAKVVVVHESTDGYFMTVVPANQHVDLGTLAYMSGRPIDRLATESELAILFPDCEVGAMPPFGTLYGMDMYVDEEFLGHDEIYFQAGNHHEVVLMKFEDFRRAAGPFSGVYMLRREAV